MFPVYKLQIDDDPESGIDYLGFVENPAHMKDALFFSKEEKRKLFFNEEQRIVAGVMIQADMLIYRFDDEVGDHYVQFDKNTIRKGVEKFHRNSFDKNVNLHHDPNQSVNGVYMVQDYIVDLENGVNAPSYFNQNVTDGSWIAFYKVENDEVWNKWKSGEINGFSIEGFFSRVPVKIKTKNTKTEKSNLNKKDNEMKKTRLQKIVDAVKEIFEDEATEDITMGEASTDAGLVVMWEGELAVGTSLTVEVDGEKVAAPEGAHSLTGEFEGVSVVVDADGMVQEIVEEPAEEEPEQEMEEEQEMNEEEPEEEEEASDEEMSAAFAQISETFKAQTNKLKEEFKSELDELKTIIKAQAERIEELEKQPTLEPTKKVFKRKEVKKSRPVNPIINQY